MGENNKQTFRYKGLFKFKLLSLLLTKNIKELDYICWSKSGLQFQFVPGRGQIYAATEGKSEYSSNLRHRYQSIYFRRENLKFYWTYTNRTNTDSKTQLGTVAQACKLAGTLSQRNCKFEPSVGDLRIRSRPVSKKDTREGCWDVPQCKCPEFNPKDGKEE